MRALAVLALVLALVLVAGAASAQEVVAARMIPAGARLSAADLRVPAARPGAARLIEGMLGLEAVRAIYAGRPVTPGDLAPPTLVRRNDLVRMRFVGGRLEIRAEGRALEAGRAGERVRVLNLDSRQPVTGRVVAPSEVEIRR